MSRPNKKQRVLAESNQNISKKRSVRAFIPSDEVAVPSTSAITSSECFLDVKKNFTFDEVNGTTGEKGKIVIKEKPLPPKAEGEDPLYYVNDLGSEDDRSLQGDEVDRKEIYIKEEPLLPEAEDQSYHVNDLDIENDRSLQGDGVDRKKKCFDSHPSQDSQPPEDEGELSDMSTSRRSADVSTSRAKDAEEMRYLNNKPQRANEGILRMEESNVTKKDDVLVVLKMMKDIHQLNEDSLAPLLGDNLATYYVTEQCKFAMAFRSHLLGHGRLPRFTLEPPPEVGHGASTSPIVMVPPTSGYQGRRLPSNSGTQCTFWGGSTLVQGSPTAYPVGIKEFPSYTALFNELSSAGFPSTEHL